MIILRSVWFCLNFLQTFVCKDIPEFNIFMVILLTWTCNTTFQQCAIINNIKFSPQYQMFACHNSVRFLFCASLLNSTDTLCAISALLWTVKRGRYQCSLFKRTSKLTAKRAEYIQGKRYCNQKLTLRTDLVFNIFWREQV